MGFPVGYSELLVPKLLVNIDCVLGFIRTTICWILRSVGAGGFLEPETSWPDHRPGHFDVFSPVPVSAQMIRERLPVVRFGSLPDGFEVVCVICLNQLERHQEIRPLANCSHIFHKVCVDKWLDHAHTTCPLCRSPFLPQGTQTGTAEDSWTVQRISRSPSHGIQNRRLLPSL